MLKCIPDFGAVTPHLEIVESRLAELGDSACRTVEQRTSPIASLLIATQPKLDAQPQPFNYVKASDLIENGEFDISANIDISIDIAETVFRQAEVILRDHRPEVIHVFTPRSERQE